eukprot:6929266-Prorocentrum_lima.AAC.1
MTSSLVGSEMCIRDSPTGAPLVRNPYQPGGLFGMERRRSSKTTQILSTCLLYTSDAADDM